MTKMEIHVGEDGLCKIFQGKSRRVFHSTGELVGLALLGIKPEQTNAGTIHWTDYLAKKGLAFGALGNKAITLQICPTHKRTITWKIDNRTRELEVEFPNLLFAIRFVNGSLNKTGIWVIQPGFEGTLCVTSTDARLNYFPYGNVHSTGIVCWGRIHTTDIREPSEVEEIFFRSGFNEDLWVGSMIGESGNNLPEVVENYRGKLPLPYNYTKSVASVVQDMVRQQTNS